MSGALHPETDGRFARTTRTGLAIVDAFISLVHEHGQQPTMEAVADEALITVRTLYRHFPEASGVVVAALARSMAASAPPDVETTPSKSLTHRISGVTAGWSWAAESNLVLWALAAAIPVDDPDVVSSLAESRAVGRAQLRAIFAKELGRRDLAARAVVLDAVESALSVACWYGLRTDQGASVTRARRVTEVTIAGALSAR